MFCKKCKSENIETRVIFISNFSSNKFINKIINIIRKLVPRKLKKKNFKKLMICEKIAEIFFLQKKLAKFLKGDQK